MITSPLSPSPGLACQGGFHITGNITYDLAQYLRYHSFARYVFSDGDQPVVGFKTLFPELG